MSTSILNGKTIVKSEIDADRQLICLTDETGVRHWLSAVGGCCSRSWFEHVSGFVAPFKILEVPELRMLSKNKKVWDANETELTQIYSVAFVTDHGRADIELRNESNGYYGGEIMQSTEEPHDQCGHTIDDVPPMLRIEGDL